MNTQLDEERIKICIYPCNTLQPCAIRLEGCVASIAQTVPEGQVLDVRAATDVIKACGVDGHLMDIRELGAFSFEYRRYWTPVTDIQQLQCP